MQLTQELFDQLGSDIAQTFQHVSAKQASAAQAQYLHKWEEEMQVMRHTLTQTMAVLSMAYKELQKHKQGSTLDASFIASARITLYELLGIARERIAACIAHTRELYATGLSAAWSMQQTEEMHAMAQVGVRSLTGLGTGACMCRLRSN